MRQFLTEFTFTQADLVRMMLDKVGFVLSKDERAGITVVDKRREIVLTISTKIGEDHKLSTQEKLEEEAKWRKMLKEEVGGSAQKE